MKQNKITWQNKNSQQIRNVRELPDKREKSTANIILNNKILNAISLRSKSMQGWWFYIVLAFLTSPIGQDWEGRSQTSFSDVIIAYLEIF